MPQVTVDDETVGAIDGPGLLVYLGVTHDDGPDEIAWTARKIWDLRLLRDEQSASDVGAPVLVVSQFTLYGDARKGRRPTWQAAAPGPVSEPAYDAVCARARTARRPRRARRFGADMRVTSVNDGPITLVADPPTSPTRPKRRVSVSASTGQRQTAMATSATEPTWAVTFWSTASALGASVRSVHSPSPAKNRKCPVADVGTSAVNSPVRSSSRT